MSVAAVGDSTFISGFKLVGVVGITAETVEAANTVLRELVEEGKYSMIILPERFVKSTQELRSKLMRERGVRPIFAFIPDHTDIKGERIEELKRSISLAVGAELKL